MTSRRGISLLDLINLPPGSLSLIPPDIAAQLERFAIIDVQSTTSTGAFIHHGTIQSAADVGLPALRNWPVEAPGLNAGLPFRLAVKRVAASGGQNLEPAAEEFRLDLFLERISIIVPGLRPARLVPAAGATAAHLVPDPRRRTVRIFGTGILRIAANPQGGAPLVRFIDFPDPFDPDAPTGPVFTIGFDPPHFFLGGSSVGLTIDRLTYDDSEEFTPAEIVARGQPASWRGIAIREATVYLPRNAPVVGDLSVGVRDVLLGSPFGMQGEVRIEFGQTPVDPALVLFVQQTNGSETPLAAPAGSGRARTVTFAAGTTGTARVRASLPSGANARWTLPDGSADTGLATRYFTARAGDVLRFQALETVEGEELASPEITFTFREPDAPAAHAPKINVTVGGSTHANATHISGRQEALEGMVFEADPPSDDLTWQLGSGSVPASGRGSTFAPDPPSEVGRHLLVLRDPQGHERRLEIEVLEAGRRIVGHAGGASDDSGPVALRAVEATFDLGVFHKEGRRSPFAEDATLVDPMTVDVPQGALAEVTLEVGRPDDPDAAPDPRSPETLVRHVQVLMDFDDTTPLAWGEARPPGAGAFRVEELRNWAANFPDAQFVVIGRCDDIGQQAYNRNLANERAGEGERLLTDPGRAGTAVDAARVFARGEQTRWADSDPDGETFEPMIDPPLSPEESEAAISDPDPDGWLMKRRLGDPSWVAERGITPDAWPTNRDPSHAESERERQRFRRVDIYAVGGTPAADTPTEPQDEENFAASLRRTLIPGDDVAAVQPPAPREPDLPFRVRLIVRWDSPTVVELADAIPTMAELTIAWQAEPIPVPGTSGNVTPVRDPSAPGPEIFTFVGRWSYDARSGETVFTLALDSAGDPNGLFPLIDTEGSGAGNVLAVALALGPALMAGIAAADIDGAAVRIGALVAASTVAAIFARNGKVVVFGIEVEHRQRALDSVTGSRQRLLFDYSVEIGFRASAAGISIETNESKPLRVRYKNVGIEVDNSREGLDRLGMVYEDVSFEIEDPGQWTINGPLGELLRVTGARAGSGSTWLEVDLAFALDLGVITITGATVRLTFESSNVGIELRGLAAAVDIPGTLRGSGRISLGDGGAIRAGLDVEIIPAQIQARGALALQADVGFVAIEVGVIFAAGIPLGQSGLGIFGFVGRFVSNGTRDLPALPDPIEREIQWYRKVPEQKYRPERGQWALGFGAVVGTLPDTAFTFNALGMLSIEFPDPSVVFGIDAKFISRPGLPSEQGSSPPPGTLLLLGLISVDSTAVKLGIRGSYEIPKLLRLSVPVSGYFPYPSTPGDAYLRVGADGFEGRLGDPVSLVLLPDTLEVTAWSYLMIEEKRLHRLGGDDRFNFDGFSIGFGAGWGINWSAGPIRLTASAKVLAGVGTKPLMVVAGIFVRGELSLVVVSVSARGEIILKLVADVQRLEGEFCGKVDLFFFSIEGCVGIAIGTEPGLDIPVPESPLTGIDLTDRRGIVTARAVTGAPGVESTVWPDTVPVLHFAHYIQTRLEPGSAFAPAPEIPGPVWSGTSELKYAYRLVGVDIVPAGGDPLEGPLDSTWWLPSHRGGVMEPGPEATSPSEHEGRDLALLSWHPAPWARNLGEGAEDAPGDPSHTVDDVCDPSPEPQPACALGQNAERLSVDRVRLRPDSPSSPPFPSYFEILGRESFGGVDLETVTMLAAEAGVHLVPGQVQSLPAPFSVPDHPAPLVAAYELPYVARQQSLLTTLQFDGQFAPQVAEPDLVLALCRVGPQPPRVREECDDFSDLQPGTQLPTIFPHGTITYENLAPNAPMRAVDWMPAAAPDGVSELNFSAKGIRVRLPFAAESVAAHVAQFTGQPIKLQAFRSDGSLVGEATSSTAQKTVEVLEVEGQGIVEVVLSGGGGEGLLLKLCYTFQPVAAVAAGPMPRTVLRAIRGRAAIGRFPRVIGIQTDGVEVPWKPQVVGSAKGDNDLRECVFVQYLPPHRGPWRGVRILPWQRTRLAVVSSCAITWEADQAWEDDQRARDDFVTTWNDRADDDTPARRHLLQPDTVYGIRVRWQWQGWRKTESQNQPPPIDDSGWSAPVEEVYSFRTAAGVTLPPNPEPVDFFDETRFDPRGVARYLLGFEPDGSGPPHFLDDPIRVHFSVDHLEPLLALYRRRLVLKIRRTDPPAGSLEGVDRPADLPYTLVWRPLVEELLPASDQRMLQAARLSGCLGEPRLGGTTAEITVDLEPNAEYDLMLVAPPDTNPEADEILIARAHFRTSRYRNPAEMLRALGFTGPDPYPIRPHDALVTTALPATPDLGNDQALEETLSALGLDPWPLPEQPRTVTIWRNSGLWELLGVMLETDEPLKRTGIVVVDGRLQTGERLSVGAAQTGGVSLTPVRSNAAWTRVLLAAPTGVVLAPDAVVTLTLTEPAGPLSGARQLTDRPRVAYQEGL